MFRHYIQESFIMVLILSGIPLAAGALVGLMVAVFQASTQIQEQSLSFAVKLSVVCLVLAFSAPWFGSEVLNFTQKLLASIALLGKMP